MTQIEHEFGRGVQEFEVPADNRPAMSVVIEKLHKQIASLEASVDEFIGRVSPVTAPDLDPRMPEDMEGNAMMKAVRADSVLVEELNSMARTLQSIDNRLHNTSHRIQL